MNLAYPLLFQPVTLMGIDELQTSWLNSTEWKMSKWGLRLLLDCIYVTFSYTLCSPLILILLFMWLILFFSAGKPVGGMNERGVKNPFQSTSPPLMRKYRQVIHFHGLVSFTHPVWCRYQCRLFVNAHLLMCITSLYSVGQGCLQGSLTGGRTERGEALFSCCPPGLLWGLELLSLIQPAMALDNTAATSPVLLSRR